MCKSMRKTLWRLRRLYLIVNQRKQRRTWRTGPLAPLTLPSALQPVLELRVAQHVPRQPSRWLQKMRMGARSQMGVRSAQIKVKVSPGVGVGGSDRKGIVKDKDDGTYTVTYAVPKRGNYMVNIECNGKPIMGSPFPVFFSTANSTGGVLGMAPSSNFPNLINQTMPNMPNYSGSVSGAFPGILGMIPGIVSGASGGAILPGIGASLAIAAAQAIVAAQALQAHAAQEEARAQSTKDSSGSAGKADALNKTVQVSNLSPILTVEQLKQLFSFCGTVVQCTITDSKHFAYLEYLKPEEATAALALNSMEVRGRPLNVEMAKTLPQKPFLLNSSRTASSLPMVMQQMQFQQALLMQQTLTAQQAANRAASMKSATELAAARAAEISENLKADGFGTEEKEVREKSRSPSTSLAKSKSRSRSPINYRRKSRARSPITYHQRRRSQSYSPPSHRPRYRRSRSPHRSRHHSRYDDERRLYGDRDARDRAGRRDLDRSREHRSSVLRSSRRSVSPRRRRTNKDDSDSPRHVRESSPHRGRKLSCGGSRSPRHHRGSKSKLSPRNDIILCGSLLSALDPYTGREPAHSSWL